MDVLDKYNVSVPRYTSYPPANYFEEMDSSVYLNEIAHSNSNGTPKISFYIHMPFCRRLCHYCGCNSYIMPNDQEIIKEYISSIHHELDIIASQLDKKRPISQIHYGGGSPTAMDISVFKELNEHILSLFPSIEHSEIAIECHPGYLTENDWIRLTQCGFNRFSIGIQDFEEKVLTAVGRTPSLLPINEIIPILHDAQATVNLDFLYGLPYQTPESFAKTISQAIDCNPDRLVTFGYGHVPWVFKRQQILEKIGLPTSESKQKMFDSASQLLTKAGYKRIGLDHFVLPKDELYKALKEGLLYRNFQGYCTRRTTGQVYALGVTGITQLDSLYVQNTKDILEYIQLTKENKLSIKKGYKLSSAQRIVKEVIERLMCNYRISWKEIALSLSLTADEVKKSINYDEKKLKEMDSDGIIQLSEEGLIVTELGHPFVRNVAAAIDPLMKNTTKQFSKPV